MMSPSLSEKRWYAVQCLAHREAGAAAQLRNQDFSTFLPRRRRLARHARRIEIKLTSFFPGYLFVQLDLSRDRWRSVNGTFGVARLVMCGDQPVPVPRGVVENLQANCDLDGILDWQPALTLGEDVRILSGPFADLVCELEGLDAQGRVRVLLEIMGGSVSMVLPRTNVCSAAGVP
jgi:transcription elongation factor/antiterminator RfaH